MNLKIRLQPVKKRHAGMPSQSSHLWRARIARMVTIFCTICSECKTAFYISRCLIHMLAQSSIVFSDCWNVIELLLATAERLRISNVDVELDIHLYHNPTQPKNVKKWLKSTQKMELNLKSHKNWQTGGTFWNKQQNFQNVLVNKAVNKFTFLQSVIAFKMLLGNMSLHDALK